MKQYLFYRRLFFVSLSLLLFAAGCSDNSGGSSNKYSGAKLLNVADSVLLTNDETFTVKIFYAKGLANMSSTALTAETSDYKICKVTSKSSAAADDSCLALITLEPGTDFGKATVKVRFYNIADNAESGEIDINVVHQEKAVGGYIDNIGGVKLYMQYVEGGTSVLGIPTTDSLRLVGTKEYRTDSVLTPERIHQHYPRKKVSMEDFYMSRTEVTNKLYKAVMGTAKPGQDDDERPVVISFFECRDFTKKLSKLTGRNYRMVTRDEWEYAAIGGQKSKGYIYPGSNNLEDVAWSAHDFTGGGVPTRPTFVAQKAPNELGLYDMAGNLYEWVNDSILHYYYMDGKLWHTEYLYAGRGGSYEMPHYYWRFYPWHIKYLFATTNNYGIRLVISRKDYEMKPVE